MPKSYFKLTLLFIDGVIIASFLKSKKFEAEFTIVTPPKKTGRC